MLLSNQKKKKKQTPVTISMDLKRMMLRDFPGGPVGKTPCPPVQGLRVHSLVKELDPTCMPQLRVHMPQLKDPTCCSEDPVCHNEDPVQP